MRRLLPAALLAGVLLLVGACAGEERTPILVEAHRITVFNLTNTAWRDVEVWLNDHYRVQAAGLAPGQRLEVPIGEFMAAFGQRFDKKRQVPFGIEVDAMGADGKAVRLTWGKGRRR
jgi:hypothetical protein